MLHSTWKNILYLGILCSTCMFSKVHARPAVHSRTHTEQKKLHTHQHARTVVVSKEDDLLLPRIQRAAPLPKVFHRIQLTSAPSSVHVQILQGKKPLSCLPANKTPCTFEISAYTPTTTLHIILRHKGRTLRYKRVVRGKSMQLDVWFLKIPTVLQPSTVIVTKRILKIRPRPRRRHPQQVRKKKGIPVAVWIVGSVLILGGIGAGIGVAVATSNHVSFQMR